MGADFANQPLGEDAAKRRRNQIGLNADVDQPGDRAGGVIRVESGESQMSRQGRLSGNGGGLPVANLPHHHDVGVLPQHRSHRRREGESRLLVHLRLVDAGDARFDGIFDRGDVQLIGVQQTEHGIQRRRFSRAGRTGHQHDTVGLTD